MVLRALRPGDPREVGGFTLHGRLGEGGQGVVFLGASPDGQQVAVKLLHADFHRDPEARRHFQRELTALQRVAPFCTARVLAADPDAEPPYVVSEFIEGPALQDAIRDHGVLAGPDLERLAIATATALGAVHAAGVVHRDFKPANVLLAADGPRVIDFGIARPLEATAATVSGVVGTPAYMAPEQLSGHPAGPPMDMFAWACTLAFAANGRPPFGSDPLPAVINRILNGQPDLGGLRGRVRDFVAACLDKDPARRPTARQVLLGLMEEAAQGNEVFIPPAVGVSVVRSSTTQPGSHRGRRAFLIAGAAALSVIVATATTAAIISLRPDRTSAPPTTITTSASAGSSTEPSASETSVGQIARSPRLGLEFWQQGNPAIMQLTDAERYVTTVKLRPGQFELRLPKLGPDQALQICAWTDASVHSIQAGGKTADHRCFSPGTGLADAEYGTGTLYLNQTGHNYLGGTRVARHSDTQDKVLISTLVREGASTPLASFRGSLYLTAFIDLDGDKTFRRAGPGEYEFLTLDVPS